MTDTVIENDSELHLDIHEFIQAKLDEGASPPALASMLIFHANKVGFDFEVDPRWVLLNSLRALEASLEHQLVANVDDSSLQPEDELNEFQAENVVDIRSAKTLH